MGCEDVLLMQANGGRRGARRHGAGGETGPGSQKLSPGCSWYEPGFSLLGGPDSTLNTPVAISSTSVAMLLPHPGQTL